jgi:hypothetical protein
LDAAAAARQHYGRYAGGGKSGKRKRGRLAMPWRPRASCNCLSDCECFENCESSLAS